MKREIKFRVWDKAENEFGDLSEYESKHWFNRFGDTQIPESLIIQQYTGLNDKNGKEIYEGDIIRIVDDFNFDENYPSMHEVIYDEHMGTSHMSGFRLKNRHAQNCIWRWTTLEVVGNIYENPELLKQND